MFNNVATNTLGSERVLLRKIEELGLIPPQVSDSHLCVLCQVNCESLDRYGEHFSREHSKKEDLTKKQSISDLQSDFPKPLFGLAGQF